MLSICELPNQMRGASWGDDDTIVFATNETQSGLWQVSASGGEPKLLTTPARDQGEVNHLWPEVLPGSNAVLFTIVSPDEFQIAVLRLDTMETTVLFSGGGNPRYSPTGHLLYGTDGYVWAVGFDLERLETVGDPVPVQEDVLTKIAGSANFGVADDGSLIYVPDSHGLMGEQHRLVWVDRTGEEDEVPAELRPYRSLKLSPDGTRVAVEIGEPANADVWVYDLTTNIDTRLTVDPATDAFPLWTPDGNRVFFASVRNGPWNIYDVAANGTGQVSRVVTANTIQIPQAFAPDGRTLVFSEVTSDTGLDLALLDVSDDSEVVGSIRTEFRDSAGVVSPDGRWLAYVSDESGEDQTYVRPFPDLDAGRWQISSGFGVAPVWGPDSRELFYQTVDNSGDTAVMRVTIATEPEFRSATPSALFQGAYRLGEGAAAHAYDISPDGQRFLMVKEDLDVNEPAAQPRIAVTLNWAEELTRLVPTP